MHEKKRFSTILPSNIYYSYKMQSVWYLHHVKIILWGLNIFKRHILLPRINISMTNQSYFLPKWVLTPERKTSCYMVKMSIFPKFFGDIMSHIIRLYADEKVKHFFELFINKNFEYTFSLSFLIGLQEEDFLKFHFQDAASRNGVS